MEFFSAKNFLMTPLYFRFQVKSLPSSEMLIGCTSHTSHAELCGYAWVNIHTLSSPLAQVRQRLWTNRVCVIDTDELLLCVNSNCDP